MLQGFCRTMIAWDEVQEVVVAWADIERQDKDSGISSR